MLKTISRTTPAKLIEISYDFFKRMKSPINYCDIQLLHLIAKNWRLITLTPTFYFPSRASLRIFSILVVIKSIATVLVTPSGMITCA